MTSKAVLVSVSGVGSVPRVTSELSSPSRGSDVDVSTTRAGVLLTVESGMVGGVRNTLEVVEEIGSKNQFIWQCEY